MVPSTTPFGCARSNPTGAAGLCLCRCCLLTRDDRRPPMPLGRVIVGAMATACFILPALSQTSAPPANPSPLTPEPGSNPPMPTPEARPGPFITQADRYVRSSKLIGVDVVGADVTRIGEVEELLVDSTGKVAGVVIGVGGFLGVGQKRVAIPYDKVLWNYSEA